MRLHEHQRLFVRQKHHLVFPPVDLTVAIRLVWGSDHAPAPERDVVPGPQIAPLLQTSFIPSGDLPERALYSGEAELVSEIRNPLDHLAYDVSTLHERLPQFLC